MNLVNLIGKVVSDPIIIDETKELIIQTNHTSLSENGTFEKIYYKNTVRLSEKHSSMDIREGFEIAIEGVLRSGIVYTNDVIIL